MYYKVCPKEPFDYELENEDPIDFANSEPVVSKIANVYGWTL